VDALRPYCGLCEHRRRYGGVAKKRVIGGLVNSASKKISLFYSESTPKVVRQ